MGRDGMGWKGWGSAIPALAIFWPQSRKENLSTNMTVMETEEKEHINNLLRHQVSLKKILTGRNKIQKKGFGTGEPIPEMTKAKVFVPKGAEFEVDSDLSASR